MTSRFDRIDRPRGPFSCGSRACVLNLKINKIVTCAVRGRFDALKRRCGVGVMAAVRKMVRAARTGFFPGMLVLLFLFFPGRADRFGGVLETGPGSYMLLQSATSQNPLVFARNAALLSDCLHAGGPDFSRSKGMVSLTCAHDSALLKIAAGFFPNAIVSPLPFFIPTESVFSEKPPLRPVSLFPSIPSPPPDRLRI